MFAGPRVLPPPYEYLRSIVEPLNLVVPKRYYLLDLCQEAPVGMLIVEHWNDLANSGGA